MVKIILRKFLTQLRWNAIRLRGIYICYLIRLMGGVCLGPVYIDRGFLFKYPPHAGWRIGRNVVFGKNVVIDVPIGGKLLIGDNVKFNMDVVIAASSSIKIGDYTQVAEFVSIRDSDHGLDVRLTIAEQPLVSQEVFIGCDVWIGRGVGVLKGSIIEDGAVIGANALVKGLIEKNSIAVGVPAKVVKVRKAHEKTSESVQ